jgi:hypothetical protein
VAALAAVEDGTLHGVELVQRDATGGAVRTVRAPRAKLADGGGELHLWEGTVRTGADERAFFRGELRLPLPGLAPADWAAALAAGAR